MAGGLDFRQGKRVTMGLAPSFYDRYDKTFPSATTERIIYSVRQADGTLLVVGIVEITYSDDTKVTEISAERLEL